jgi:Na+-transporting NADH:ubiquinone oxidoreductase subunit A
MREIHLKKGYTLPLSGSPAAEAENVPTPARVAAVAERIRFLAPRVRVKVGDRVQVGSLLFEDKRRAELLFRSPSGGTVSAVHFGPRRSLQEIVIDRDEEEAPLEFGRLSTGDLAAIERGELLRRVIDGGLWSLIRELPFRSAARPEELPAALFVHLDNLDPFHPLPQVYLHGREALFAFGIRVLERLAGSPAVVSISRENAAALDGMKVPVTYVYRGCYPAHDPGVLLYRTKTSSEQNRAWYVDGQDVLRLAELLSSGRYPVERVVALGGPSVTAPRHLRTLIGVPLSHLAAGRTDAGRLRYLVGGVLSGHAARRESYLGMSEASLVVMPEGDEPGSFLGWAMPGSAVPSRSRAFLSAFTGRATYAMDCNRHGGLRACIQCNFCPEVCPVDILPQLAYKAVLAGEVEEALAHGLLDCVECGLCSFVCPSKIELLQTLRAAREQFYHEMR